MSVSARPVVLAIAVACVGACAAPWWPWLGRSEGADAGSLALSGLEPPSAHPDRALQPLPPAPVVDPKRAALGARLFADPTLAADGTVACATCHPLDRGGADGLSHSRGAGGRETALNTPTVYNATFNFRFNWSGVFSSLEAEFDAPVARAMNTSWAAIVEKLSRVEAYRAEFGAAYRDGITPANIKDALARYIETLVTPNARFDQFLRGDADALDAEERREYELFEDLGCSACHQGANIGGNLSQRFGVMKDYFEERVRLGGPPPTEAELGLGAATKNPADRHVFRVPSLRNVALTAPYFHDGSAPTLESAVRTMARTQIGRALAADEVSAIVAFLKTLTGVAEGAAP
jgi:cytochrome c peroxidase